MSRKVGAPKGGRVHWILWELPIEFKGAYTLAFDYSRHEYIFYRMEGRHLYDAFVIKRTSRHYFRAVYMNVKYHEVEFFGAEKPKNVAEKCYDLYLYDKNLRDGG